MVGRSPAMQSVFDVLDKASTSDATILLEGETGTGKEVSAEAIHRGSPRRDKPFLVVDCGAMPPQLLESELFGHERGAFTGAVSSRQGVFEAANGGTVFLDEIGELAIDLQPKLLRVLERREVRRVGTNNHVPVNVRLIAATNRSLREQVGAHKFRSDLYYRLAVVEVKLPPLRERLADLPAAGRAHRAQPRHRRRATRRRPCARPAFLGALAEHSWPGNIRELRNYLERCVALHDFAPPRSAGGHGASRAPRAPSTSASRCARRARPGSARSSAATWRSCCASTRTASARRRARPASIASTSTACSGSTACASAKRRPRRRRQRRSVVPDRPVDPSRPQARLAQA